MELPAFDYTLYEENCGHEWRNWLRSFEWYLKANRVENDDDKFVKLMHLAGRKVQEVYETLPTPPAVIQIARGPLATGLVPHLTEYELALTKLNDFFEPKKNTTYERHMFRLIKQEKGERVGIFAMRLRTQAEKCDFGNTLDDNIKDQIIEKCVSTKLRRELLKLGDNVKMEQVMKAAKIFEAIEETSKTFDPDSALPRFSAENVNKIDSKGVFKRNFSTKDKQIECTRCGFNGHRSFDDKCPAKGKTYNKCGGRDHFSRKCRTKKRARDFGFKTPSESETKTEVKRETNEHVAKKPKLEEQETVKMLEFHEPNDNDRYLFCIDSETLDRNAESETAKPVDSNEPDDESEYILCVNNGTSNTIIVKIGGVKLEVVIDSGSKFNIIDSKTWEFLKANNIVVFYQSKDVTHSFKSYGGHPLTTLGTFKALIETKFNSCVAEFIVVKDYGKVLIGYQTGKYNSCIAEIILVTKFKNKA